MAKISQHTIEQVRGYADIVDVVSEYVDLKKRGRNFFGLCPFHSEKTPSFSVNQDKQMYHCFGCGAGGGAIHFVMQLEKLEFLDAVKHLAEKYGLKIAYDSLSGSKQIGTQIGEIHDIAMDHFHRNLLSTAGKAVFAHLLDRGLTSETIKKFGLGYSLNDWQSLLNVIRKHEFTPEAILQSGLFINSEKGYFDRFRGRIMFPIHNGMGKTVAFAGRVFETDDPAKYVNSPETMIYHESKILYGLWAVRHQLRDTDAIIVVEGYFDFLQLYQAGIHNVVAVSGTALTEDHSRELHKYSRKIIMAYDGDSAGISAAIRAGYILLRNDIEPRVARIPKGIDPDDWVRTNGPAPFKFAVDNAVGLIHFHSEKFQGSLDNPTDKTRFAKEVIREISAISDEITRQVYVQHLASTLNITEKALYSTLDRLGKVQSQRGLNRQTGKPSGETVLKDPATYQPLEDEIIQLCFIAPARTRTLIMRSVSPDWFTSPRLRTIYKQLAIHPSGEGLPDAVLIIDELEDPLDREKLSALIFRSDDLQSSPEFAADGLARMEKRFLTRQLDQARKQLQKAESEGDDVTPLIVRIEEIKSTIRSLHTKYTELFSEQKT